MSAKVKLTTEEKKEKARAYYRSYYKKNKGKLQSYYKKKYQDDKADFVIIYQIPNYDGMGNNYCGMTENLDSRMHKHRSLGKLNVSDWSLLGIATSRKEAREIEAEFHSQGYHGAYSRDSGLLETEINNFLKQ